MTRAPSPHPTSHEKHVSISTNEISFVWPDQNLKLRNQICIRISLIVYSSLGLGFAFFFFQDDGGDYDAMETGSHTSRARLNQRGSGGYASQMGRRSTDYAASEASDISAGPEKWRRVRRGAEAVLHARRGVSSLPCMAVVV